MHTIHAIILNVILCCWEINAAHTLFLTSKQKTVHLLLNMKQQQAKLVKTRFFIAINAALIGLTAQREGLQVGTPQEARTREEAILAAQRLFVGARGPVECGYAFERFGPNGSEVEGLLVKPSD